MMSQLQSDGLCTCKNERLRTNCKRNCDGFGESHGKMICYRKWSFSLSHFSLFLLLSGTVLHRMYLPFWITVLKVHRHSWSILHCKSVHATHSCPCATRLRCDTGTRTTTLGDSPPLDSCRAQGPHLVASQSEILKHRKISSGVQRAPTSQTSHPCRPEACQAEKR